VHVQRADKSSMSYLHVWDTCTCTCSEL